jgi:NAD(P)-dependent dehydrogenase (short-subunit alcohol dehydrogenase family)
MAEGSPGSMKAKVCVITGASSGIGKSSAAGLAKLGATVVMVCRNKGRGETARDEIRKLTSVKEENLDLMVADLSSLDSVRSLATSILGNYQGLDVLINNAGLILSKRTPTPDGLETTFEVNYLSHFLLTNLLLSLLKASAPSRIINVSSDAHVGGRIRFDDLQGEGRYRGMKAYSQSKLAQILFTHELSRRLDGTGVTVNSVHPGVVRTNWGRTGAGVLSVVLKLVGPFARSPEKGADTVVYLASSPEVGSVTGKYFFDRKATRSSKESYDEADSEKLWRVSETLAGLTELKWA